MSEFNIRDPVQQKSGGPIMTPIGFIKESGSAYQQCKKTNKVSNLEVYLNQKLGQLRKAWTKPKGGLLYSEYKGRISEKKSLIV